MDSRPNRLEKRRDQRQKRRLRLGGYLIITDAAETEVNYFNGFRSSIPSNLKNDLQFKVFSSKELKTIIDFALSERNKDVRFRNVWIVFDRDEVSNFEGLIDAAKQAQMNAGWSNPCFEIWMSAYFGKMKNVNTSIQCCTEFGRLLLKYTNKKAYKKSDEDIYDVLIRNGNENEAICLAKRRYEAKSTECQRPSEMTACTTVYQLIEEIKEKMQE